MEANIPFLLVDDDESIILSLKTLINKVFPKSIVYIATDGVYASDFINKLNSLTIILCDLNLPGLNGLQILEKMRANENTKDNYFILMTVATDKDTNVKALQKGVDEFLNKPFEFVEVLSKLRNGFKQINYVYQLQEKEKKIEELEIERTKTNDKLKNMLRQFQGIRLPEVSNQLKLVTEMAIWISMHYTEMNEKKLKVIADASSLACIGKVYLNDKYINENVTSNGLLKNEIMEKIPINAKEILSNVGDFEDVTDIIYHIYENFDGSGYPEKIKSWQIPLGARILRVLLDYLEIAGGKMVENSKLIEQLTHETNRIYDFKVVALFDQYFARQITKSRRSYEVPVRRIELKEGMVITRNIITESGIKLVGSEVKLTADSLETLLHITETDPVIGNIYVRDMENIL